MQAERGTIFKKAINNFVFTAYNNIVEEITITQNGFNQSYMSYLFSKVQGRFSFLPGDMDMQADGDQTKIALKLQSAYCPYVRKFAEENIADVLAIGYKYAFFEKHVPLPLLNEEQKHVLLTALVAADYKEDKAYIARRIGGSDHYCLDGVFYFRLQQLKKRWEDIVNYVPADMGVLSMEGFMEFLAEDGEEKLFVKEGNVYDKEYRLLSKSMLTGKRSTVAELLLGGAGQVYCFGDVDEGTSRFLKRYYPTRTVFC